jgi:hypothetical protein
MRTLLRELGWRSPVLPQSMYHLRVVLTTIRRLSGLAEICLGSAAIGSQWVQPLRHGDPIDVWAG